MARKLVGKVTHYFPKVGVAVIALSGSLSVGEFIEIEKEGNLVRQEVTSMQVEHAPLQKAKKGMEVGLKVDGTVKPGASVYVV